MEVLVVANINLGENEGIYKKVVAEATALGQILGSAKAVLRRGNEAVYLEMPSGRIISRSEKSIYRFALEIVRSARCDILYVRHARPSVTLLNLLKAAAKGRTEAVIYEIPTYPYFAEQLRASRAKHRAVAKIGIDIFFWPFIYRYVDHLFVVRSRRSTHRFRKMINIVNGVDTTVVRPRIPRPPDDTVRLAAVGTLYPYHGYDRVLRGLERCRESADGRTVELHIIGRSATIDDLRAESEVLGLNHVTFHGVRDSNELNQMFDQYDLGLGCLALHRRNADIDTTLKLAEYCCRGLPVLTSGESPLGPGAPATLMVASSDEPLDIPALCRELASVTPEQVDLLARRARTELTWDAVFRDALSRANLPIGPDRGW